MSKPIQTVEELDAALHWRRKHALAIKERDALQQRLTAADERIDMLNTALARIHFRCDAFLGDDREMPVTSIEVLRDIAAVPGLPKTVDSGSDATSCTWKHVDDRGIWDTGCGTSWAFTDEGPKENGMKFCHACGKTLMVEDSGDDD
ncbi:hypothetical protein [Pseudomonas azotoformans]